MPNFCRHNRVFADCPICTKGTVLDRDRHQPGRRARPAAASRSSGAPKRRSGVQAAQLSRGPFASAGPYDGAEIRLERVPGGLRMAAWRGGQIDRAAPVLAAHDVPGLLGEAATKELLGSGAPAAAGPEAPAGPEAAAEPGVFGASPGRTGELKDELRVERLDDDRVRIARWIMRPNRGWELQEAPVMLPSQRFTQALSAAAGKGVLAAAVGAASGGPTE